MRGRGTGVRQGGSKNQRLVLRTTGHNLPIFRIHAHRVIETRGFGSWRQDHRMSVYPRLGCGFSSVQRRSQEGLTDVARHVIVCRL